MTCVFCTEPALYVYSTAPGDAAPFCADHLPTALYRLRDTGGLATTAEFEATRKATLEQLAGGLPAKAPRAKEAPVEEPVVPAEEPAPSE